MRKDIRHIAFAGLAFYGLFSTSANAQSLDEVLFESSEHLRVGKVVEALEFLVEHENRFGQEQEFRNNLAIAYLGNNQAAKALEIVSDVVDSDPLFSIIAHNYLELELAAGGNKTDRFNPILFVQSVDSFAEGVPVPESTSQAAERIAQVPENNRSAVERTPQPPSSRPAVERAAQAPERIAEALNSERSATERRLSVVERNGSIPDINNQTLTASDRSSNDAVAARSQALLEDSLKSIVQSWAAAWSNKDFDSYISHYGFNFRPDNGLSVGQWEVQRRDRLAKPGEIEVTISNITFVGSDPSPTVLFDQFYDSVGYSDKTVKEMTFQQNNGRWKISSERSIDQ